MLRICTDFLRARGFTASGSSIGFTTAASLCWTAWLHTSIPNYHKPSSLTDGSETVDITYIDKEGKEHTVAAPLGKNLLEVAHDNEIDLEGACEGSLACSTCHLIFESEDYYKKLPEATEDELDMLDLAFGLTDTSRLGCQVIVTKELDGARVRIPAASRNFYVDGHKPKPH
ncbi:hypothetical protein Vafri_2594 [Volvox africanus]|uniref:2Fe-2S ferredoxin n=1 Tax=Volvox africanus TaxID=51714 RepID=A0A8J4ERY6_9CHLO|nr:hypothetical protein Vafri_2594 [Volvox africanus]